MRGNYFKLGIPFLKFSMDHNIFHASKHCQYPLNLYFLPWILDQLDLDETVEKVKQELFDDNGDLEPVGLVQALASGAEVAPSEGGKYPHKSESIKPIKIPKVHFEVRKTAIDRHRLGQMSPFIYQLLTKGKILFVLLYYNF